MSARQSHDQSVDNNDKDASHEGPAWQRLSSIPEILSLIFTFCLSPYNAIPSENDAPLLLLRVCSTWRCVALSTPRLWSGLRLKLPSKHNDRSEVVATLQRFSRMLRIYLSRAGSVDISLDVDLSGGFNEVRKYNDALIDRHTIDLVSELLPFSHQLRHLFLATPFQHIIPVLSLVERGQTPHLESLTLDFSCDSAVGAPHGDGGVQDTFTTALDVSHSRRLSSLTIYGNADDNVILRWRTAALPLSLRYVMLWNVFISIIQDSNPERPHANSLRRLSLGALIRVDELLRFLETCQNLVDLTLDVQLIWPQHLPDGLPDQIIHMYNLRRLRFSADSSTSELLDTLYAPSLSFLELTCRDVLGTRIIPARLEHFLQRSEPRLVFFMISDLSGVVQETELISLLRQMPTLEDLRIVRHGLTDVFLRALTVVYEYAISEEQALSEMRSDDPHQDLPETTRNVHSLCPRLASLIITERNRFSPQTIIDFILSRSLTHDGRSKSQARDPSETVNSSLATDRIQARSCKSDIIGDGSSASLSGPVALRSFQCIFERSELITQHPLMKICMEQGLKLTLMSS